MKSTGEQEAIYAALKTGSGDLIIDALAGSGKCLGIGTPVLLHTGRVKPVEEILPGDLLMGPDSEPRRVLATSEGDGQLYRIRPVKGESWVCNDAHVLTLQGTNYHRGQIKDIALNAHMLDCEQREQRLDRTWKLWRTGVEFASQPTPIDPYFAGLWLGDGTIGVAAITNAEPEIIAYCQSVSSRLGVECVVTATPRNNSNTISFRVGPKGLPGRTGTDRQNPVLDVIRTFVDVDGFKFIKPEFLVNSREVRLAILAGLIDTDGHVSAGSIEITSKSERMSHDICFLARSLGLAAYRHEKIATIKSIGFEGLYYRCSISGDIDEIPCLVARRKAEPRKQIKRVNVTGFDVEDIGIGHYYGFTLDGDGRFLLGDFTVTHNTSTLINALPVLPQKTVLLTAFNKRIAEELKEKLPKTPKGSVWATATFHSAGFRIVNACKRGAKLDLKPEATEELVNEAITALPSIKLGFKARRIAVRLLRTYKEIFSGPEIDVEAVKSIGVNYDSELCELPDGEIENVSYVIAKAYDLGLNLQDRTSIDYCDMIWLPVVNNLKTPSRYQAIFCDELQDLSLIQWELMKMLRAPGGRFVGVGDLNQAVYGWRGAIGKEVFAELGKDAKTMPLTTTFRCSVAVVKEAQAIVPQIKACATALPGLVQQADLETAIATMANGDLSSAGAGDRAIKSFVLSRTNAELIRVALDLYDEDVDFDFLGAQEVLGPIKDLVQKFDKSSASRFQANIDTWYQVEFTRAEKQHASAWADRLEQYHTILSLMAQRAQPSQIVNMLFDICARSANADITLSSVHKIKGLEADIVYLMRQTFHRHQPWRKEPVTREEDNLLYVAITRSRNALVYVDAEPARFIRR